jgi:hypothetical protein
MSGIFLRPPHLVHAKQDAVGLGASAYLETHILTFSRGPKQHKEEVLVSIFLNKRRNGIQSRFVLGGICEVHHTISAVALSYSALLPAKRTTMHKWF